MTREEAIKEIKSWDFLEGKEIEAIETLIPELKESEDEKIYNEIMEFFKMNEKICVVNNSYTKWIAWLEKQKENIEKQKEQKEIPLMNGDADLYFDNWIQHNDTTKRGCFEEGIRYAQRLQKEQKPAEWSEEEQQIISFAADWLTRMLERTGVPEAKHNIESVILGLKSLCPVKQEWSEEDEEIRQSIIKDIKWERDNTPVTVYKEENQMTKEDISKVLELALEYYKLEVFGTGKESENPNQERIDWIYDRMKEKNK